VTVPHPAHPEPLPADPQSAPFWDGLRAHRLTMQRCLDCGYVRWPPGRHCPQCLSTRADWAELSGRGSVWSIAVYEHAYDPEFAASLPYNVALVELAEGPMLISNLVTDDITTISIGDPVTAVFDDVSAGLSLVRFAPAPGPTGPGQTGPGETA
jgi:uncharacterized protein